MCHYSNYLPSENLSFGIYFHPFDVSGSLFGQADADQVIIESIFFLDLFEQSCVQLMQCLRFTSFCCNLAICQLANKFTIFVIDY